MRKFSFKKLIFAVLMLMVFVMPALVTYAVMQQNDKADRRAENLLEMQKAVSDHGTRSDASKMLSTECTTLPDEPEDAELSIKDNNNLTLAEYAQTSTDADAVQDMNVGSSADSSEVATEGDAAQETAEVIPNGRKVYLTFDDGPSDYTDELLDILDKYNVKATFFVVVNSYKYKDQLNRILNDGHTLGLHSKSHVYSKIYADYQSYVRDVYEVHNWVYKLTGYDSKYYRFPGGSSNNVTNVPISECVSYLHRNGYEYYDWNSESRDAENLYLTPEQLNDNVMNYVRNSDGNVTVLMHDLDDHYNTIEALPALIETLQSEGFELCPIDENTVPVQHYIPQEGD